MEAFKEVERTMKTKMFSKEGLSMAAKLDPKEQEKEDIKTFLSEMVDKLNEQIERLEAEIESLQAQTKKSKKDQSKAERASELAQKTERHKWHVTQLELLLRSVENETVEPEQIRDTAEEGIKDYVDNNDEVDFVEGRRPVRRIQPG